MHDTPATETGPTRWRRDAVVVAGGALGTLARAGIAEVLPTAEPWPWATFTANLLGTAALAVLLVVVTRRRAAPRDPWIAFVGTGVLGSFTTFSAFAVEVRLLGPTDAGLAYGVTSVAAGLALIRLVQAGARGLATGPGGRA